ncbi:hypothetical protein WH95_07840 [Kiloniella litopenaei]|uniref:Uncharacterized protein n=1 Tax=Kiloniella litopenaei TaxID=1549748 RepID=A0A0M2R6R1_9PROT|nr:hypothetical protein WH95_07840 [Kiloniella litopenaei]
MRDSCIELILSPVNVLQMFSLEYIWTNSEQNASFFIKTDEKFAEKLSEKCEDLAEKRSIFY